MKGKLLALASIIAGVALVPTVSAQTLTELNSNFTHDEANKIYTVKDETVTISDKLEISEDVTIDLNGKTLKITGANNSILVSGEHTLTIKDSSEAKSGKITSDYYGIGAKGGATIIVESGTIESKYAALTSNNTTGKGNFTVKGGVLTTSEGPAIYMPSQGDLTITNGTINGGISLRLGNVNISGGEINATTGNIDNVEDTYYRAGNAFFADALYILAGTYTQGDDNSVKLNITGGTFNSENGQGSAIAVYDLGKVEQIADISISGNAVLKTNAENRHAYDVLSLEDLGITEVTEGYGQKSGNTTTAINGGTFIGGLESKYIPEGMQLDENGALVKPQEVSNSTETTKEDAKNPNTSDVIIYSVIGTIIAALGLTFIFKKLHNN